mgnify:CR=1 FL=1
MKQLRRKVIIREYDFNRIMNSALKLYDSIEFEPITLNQLKQEHLFKILSGTKLPQPMYGEYTYPRNYLYEMRNYLYNTDYAEWFSKYDEDGYMYIQSKRNAPESILGWAIFEYKY